MARKHRSKSAKKTREASQKRVLNAYDIAMEQEQQQLDSLEPESNTRFGGVVLNASGLLGQDQDDDAEVFEDEELDSDEAFGSNEDIDEFDTKVDDDLDDDENLSYDGIDESELMPLSAVWDRNEALDAWGSVKSLTKDIVLDDDDVTDDSESDSDDGYGSSSSEDPFAEMRDLESDVELDNVKTNLESQKPKEKKNSELINDTATASEFGLPTEGQGLSFADMMVGDDDTQPLLIDHGDEEKKAFSVPLPASVKKLQERKAAYDIQREDVEKWKDTVEANRQAEVLKFDSGRGGKGKTKSSFEPTEKPINALEAKLDAALAASNVEDKKTELMFNQIETAKMNKTEMLKRTRELRMMRELMYRGAKDSKRLKKIKSKAYRRILRKEREKNKQLVEGDSDEDDEETAAYNRAVERMTLKHKNTSKWAKKMLKSGMAKDKETRDEVEEMLRKGEELRRKQRGEEDHSEDDRDVSDVERDMDDVEAEETPRLGKGVLNMDFMKAAEKKQRLENEKEIEELRKLREGGSDLEVEETAVNETRNIGRRVYTPAAAVAASSLNETAERVNQEVEEDRERELTGRLQKAVKKSALKTPNDTKSKDTKPKAASDDESNPWFDDQAVQKSSKLHVIDKDSSKLDKATAKMAKKAAKKRKREEPEEEVTIEDRATLQVGKDEDYEEEGAGSNEIAMFRQQGLIKEAFAGDDVIDEEFAKEKQEIEELEDDKEVAVTAMPGWGSWAGANKKSKKKKRKVVRTVQGVVEKDNRKDRNRRKVIVNERAIKRNEKYLADKIPFPFKTREQYERSLQTPLGQDWNSRESFQKMTTPKVISKYGDVIDPLKAPFK